MPKNVGRFRSGGDPEGLVPPRELAKGDACRRLACTLETRDDNLLEWMIYQ